MKFEYKIVEAKPADSHIVGEMVYDLLMEFYADLNHLFPLEKMKQAAAELITAGSGVWSFLALDESEIIGMININECSAIYAGGKFGEITELYIKPEYRSKKVGEQLILHVKGFAKEQGWKALEVGAPDLPRCQRTMDFYENNGFNEVGPRLETQL